MKIRLAGLLTAAALLAPAGTTHAQNASQIRGFSFGAQALSTSFQLDEEGSGEAENGFGLGLGLGYAINDNIGFFLRGDRSVVKYAGDDEGDYNLNILELGARYSFSDASKAMRPYVEGGLSTARVDDEVFDAGVEYEVAISGPQLFIGGGLEYFLNRSAAVDLGLVLGKGRFNAAEVDGESTDDFEDLDMTTIRFNLGVKIHP